MFEETIEFIESTPLEFQRYLDNVHILEPVHSNYVAVVDSTNIVYFYKVQHSSNDNVLYKGKLFTNKKMTNLNAENDTISCLKLTSQNLIAVAHGTSDVTLAHWKTPKLPFQTIPYSHNVYQISAFRKDFLLLASENTEGGSSVSLYHVPSAKMKNLNIDVKSRIKGIYTDEATKAYFLLENGTAFVFSINKNKVLFWIEDRNLEKLAPVQTDILVAYNASRLFIYDVTADRLIKEHDISKIHVTPLQDMLIVKDKVYMLFEDKMVAFTLTSNKDLEPLSDLNVNAVYQTAHKKCSFKKVIHVDTCLVFTVSLYDQEGEYLNDVVAMMDLEEEFDVTELGANEHKKDKVVLSNKPRMLEKSERKKIKLMSCFNEEIAVLVTEDDIIIQYSLAKNKMINRAHLSELIKIQEITFLDKENLLVKYNHKKHGQLIDVFYLPKMKLKSNSSEYCIHRSLQFTSFITVLSNGKVLADIICPLSFASASKPKPEKSKSNVGPGLPTTTTAQAEQPSIREDGNLSFSDSSGVFGTQFPQPFDEGKRTIGLQERRMNIESEVPFFSDKSPIRYSSTTDSNPHRTPFVSKEISSFIPPISHPISKPAGSKDGTKQNTSEESEIRALLDQIAEPDKDKDKKVTTSNANEKAKRLWLFTVIARTSHMNILDTMQLEFSDAYELGGARYVALKEKKNGRVLQICDLQKKKLISKVEFVNEIGDVLAISGTRAGVATKNEEGRADLLVIFDWREKVALMAIECMNLTHLLRVVCNHLLWIDQTNDAHVISGINLKTMKSADKKSKQPAEENELSLYSGKALVYDKCIDKKKLVFVEGYRPKQLVYYDPFNCPDSLINMEIKLMSTDVLFVMHYMLGSVYNKKTIRNVYEMLYPRPRE